MKIHFFYLWLVSLLMCHSFCPNYLFDSFKELKSAIAYIPFGNLPTPIHRCYNLEQALNHENIFIKRDDLTGHDNLYGGNKVRKLEFLLADARERGAKKIVTFGGVGTNHGLATACYSKQLGLECLLMLKDQPNSPVVRQNLLLDHYFNAKIQIFPNNEIRKRALDSLLKSNNETYFIPIGGSVPLGVLGFVNAAFELKHQIQDGIIAEPDFIYLPVGSCGTTAGLLLGAILAGMRSKIVAVAIEPEEEPNEVYNKIKLLFSETNKLLNAHCLSIPLLEFPDNRLIINIDFCGTEYGLWLHSTDDAIKMIKDQEGIVVEGTYSAKSVAALVSDIRNKIRKSNEVLLLWNTYCGLDFSYLINQVNYKELPPEIHRYFEEA